MTDLWQNILIEMGFLGILGVLYYFYQRKKILKYEGNKAPFLMGYILQCCLTDRGDEASADLDPLIEALDDFQQGKTVSPPVALLNTFVSQSKGSSELRAVIVEALKELADGQK